MLSLCLICFLPMSSDGMFILSNMSVSLLSAQLAFIGAENAYSEKIRPGNLMDKSFKKISVMLICWGLPLVIVGITCAIWGRDYGYGDICWLPEKYGARWAFLGPVAVIQIFNLAVFVTILATRFALDCKKSSKLSTIVGNQVWTFVSMFPVLGLMWIFGFAVSFGQSKFMQYIYVLLASTQGFSIFLCHVMTNSNVRKTLCVKMKPDATDDSVSEGLSEDFTHSSNIVVVGDKESETTRG
ncbi:hypothetical protein FSP39_016125 [Pinctada imbricata]|uniref:G-protein coupled receptors family 2 profile 2 domain-containing protein n=1 Tax=Pinctada imbricata TaxID=66713 RepID=A0AA88XRN7_PINIB|nr:hypothetical protein FSP39_016125 [Pinctada imbricata]